MPLFEYAARDSRGNRLTGTIEAPDERAVAQQLRGMGIWVSQIKLVPRRPVVVSYKALVYFFRQMASAIKSGMHIFESLSMIYQQTADRRLREVIGQMVPKVEAGQSLSSAMALFPTVFSSWITGLIKAGERSGSLDILMGEIADQLERESRLRAWLRYVLWFMVMTLVAASFLIFAHVIIIEGGRAAFNSPSPSPRAFLQAGLSAYARSLLTKVVPFWAIVTLLYLVLTWLFRSRRRSRFLDSLALRIPIIGRPNRLGAFQRFFRTFALLTNAGIIFSEGMDTASDATGNAELADKLRTAVPMLRQGKSLSDSLRLTMLFPDQIVNMVATGEKTGTLSEILDRITFQYQTDLDIARTHMWRQLIWYSLFIAFCAGLIAFGMVAIGYYSGMFKLFEEMLL